MKGDANAFDSSASIRKAKALDGAEGSSNGGDGAQLPHRIHEARANSSQNWEELKAAAEKLEASGGVWQDPDFEHDDDSLFIDARNPPTDWLRDGERGRVLKNVRVQWCTPPGFCLSKRPLGKSLVTGKPTWLYDDKDAASVETEQTAEDVDQGSLGDCYFLSALALATRDALECSELIDDSLEAAGIFGVSFFVDGKWAMVWVDSYFPCFVSNDAHGSRPRPIYAVSHSHKEIWPMVVEKAFAKLHGSYEAIGRGGVVAAALEVITGGHSREAPAPRMSWTDLRACVEEESCFVGAGTRNDLDEGTMNGIVGGHAYSVFHALEVAAEGEGGDGVLRLLLLRNPWGHGEWKGDWSDGSSLWGKHPAAVAAVGDKKSSDDDGSFWISHADFRQRFASVDLCRVKNATLSEGARIHEVAAPTNGEGSAAGDDPGDWLSGIGEPVGPKTSKKHSETSARNKKKPKGKKKK